MAASLAGDQRNRKADRTLNENEKYEGPRILRTFSKVTPALIKPVHIYKSLDGRAAEGAPSTANKEIALLSAVPEFGRGKGVLELNPCRDVK